MNDVAIRFNHVYKRFRRGELFDTLRDLVPALVKSALRRDREGTTATNAPREALRGPRDR